jgi:ERCC4-type nuclease
MIILDDREGSRELADAIRRAGIECEVQRMEYGDCCWMGNGPEGPCLIGVERKTVQDLLASMRTGRLVGHQLAGMSEEYHAMYLIVEGMTREDPDSGLLLHYRRGGWEEVRVGQQRFMWSELEAYLTSIDSLIGIHVRRSATPRETVSLIRTLYQWWQKSWDQHSTHKVLYTPLPQHSLLVKPSVLRRVAAQLPMIGYERSGAVEKHFRTVYAMATAEEKQWREIEGIGKGIAQKVVRAIRENVE